ncbi:uncharacterized protein BJX67DRAFT_379449 [Aspergillus lucknowensis]|uniref:Uncharacterized protein n=1 Tax=Aspergillus lucknowensis TaxID=176173 RepID=A0ABR4LWN8_9EURO
MTVALYGSFAHPDVEEMDETVFREVLLSYRLLFGQSPKARRKLERLPRAEDDGTQRRIDPLILRLTQPNQPQTWRAALSSTFGRGRPNPSLSIDDFPTAAKDIINGVRDADTYRAGGGPETSGPSGSGCALSENSLIARPLKGSGAS